MAEIDKAVRRNAYLYCKFRDEQFAAYDEYVKKQGMLFKTLLVFNVLFYAEDGLTQTEICRRTLQSKQTVNLIIKNLLKEQHVTVTELPDNRRLKQVRLTAAGRAYCEKTVRHITEAEDQAMGRLSAEEQETLIKLSRKFTGYLVELIAKE